MRILISPMVLMIPISAMTLAQPAFADSAVSSLVQLSCEDGEIPKFQSPDWVCSPDETGEPAAYVVEDSSLPPKVIGTVVSDISNQEVSVIAEILSPSGFTRSVGLKVEYNNGFGKISSLRTLIYWDFYGIEDLWFEDAACAGPPAIPASDFEGFFGIADFIEGIEVDPTFEIDILGSLYMALNETANPIAKKTSICDPYGCTVVCQAGTTTQDLIRSEVVVPVFSDWRGQFVGPLHIVEE